LLHAPVSIIAQAARVRVKVRMEADLASDRHIGPNGIGDHFDLLVQLSVRARPCDQIQRPRAYRRLLPLSETPSLYIEPSRAAAADSASRIAAGTAGLVQTLAGLGCGMVKRATLVARRR
jgi:hypothetical protein